MATVAGVVAGRVLLQSIALADNSETAGRCCGCCSGAGVGDAGRCGAVDRTLRQTTGRGGGYCHQHHRSAADRPVGVTNSNLAVCKFKNQHSRSINPRLLLGNKQVAIRK